METIENWNIENSKTNEPHRFRLSLADKLNLKDPNKTWHWLIGAFITHEKLLNQHTATINLKFLLRLGNYEFDLPDGSYSVVEIQDYFEFIIKKHETLAENRPVQTYSNKIKNRVVFKVKTG